VWANRIQGRGAILRALWRAPLGSFANPATAPQPGCRRRNAATPGRPGRDVQHTPRAGGPTPFRYVTVKSMPRGRQPDGEHPLSNAERQARYRARRQAEQPPAKVRYRSPADRRTRARRWHDTVAGLVALQTEDAAWYDALYRTTSAKVPPPRPSRLLCAARPRRTHRNRATARLRARLSRTQMRTHTRNPLDIKSPIQVLTRVCRSLWRRDA
jgi:hypothetical protein